MKMMKPYLGADDAPIMKLRLKRSDGTEHKCEIRAWSTVILRMMLVYALNMF